MTADFLRPLPFGPNDKSFTVPLGPAGGIALMASALSRKLVEVASRCEPYIVILHLDGCESYFTQCLVDPDDGAYVEAVSNTYIEPEEFRLDTDQETTLAALGFEPPGEFSPNHHRLIAHPVPWSYVADLLTIPLVTVYGADRSRLVHVLIGPGFEQLEPAIEETRPTPTAAPDRPALSGTVFLISGEEAGLITEDDIERMKSVWREEQLQLNESRTLPAPHHHHRPDR